MKDEIIRTRTISKGKFLELVNIDWIDSEGNARRWEAIKRTTGTDIVSVIPITDKGKIILIEQFRPPVNGKVIEFPAGLRDEDENLQVSALRELEEETGYQAGEIRKLFAGPVSAGLSSEFLTVFLATDLKFVGKKDGREERGIIVYEIPLEEADEWLKGKEDEGMLVDVKIRGHISYIKNILVP